MIKEKMTKTCIDCEKELFEDSLKCCSDCMKDIIVKLCTYYENKEIQILKSNYHFLNVCDVCNSFDKKVYITVLNICRDCAKYT